MRTLFFLRWLSRRMHVALSSLALRGRFSQDAAAVAQQHLVEVCLCFSSLACRMHHITPGANHTYMILVRESANKM